MADISQDAVRCAAVTLSPIAFRVWCCATRMSRVAQVNVLEMPEPDFYVILGVAPTATMAEISTAFRHLARPCHVDKHSLFATIEERNALSERFLALSEARDVLMDPARRAEYDDCLAAASSSFRRAPPTVAEAVITYMTFIVKAFKSKYDLTEASTAERVTDVLYVIGLPGLMYALAGQAGIKASMKFTLSFYKSTLADEMLRSSDEERMLFSRAVTVLADHLDD